MKISKVIIPAAGLGTRFLPLTKSIPKEMVPLLNKPALHWIIEEALQANLSNILMITARGKESMADYFDAAPELDQYLRERNKSHLLENLTALIENCSFTSIRQHEARGLGHAVSLARHCVGDEYVAVMLPDDVIEEVPRSGVSRDRGIAHLLQVAKEQQASVIAVQEIPREQSSSYGVIRIQEQHSSSLFQVSGLIEKPKPQDAPSNLAIIGRYVLSPKIFEALSDVQPGALGEIQLTDAIELMRIRGEKLYAYKIPGMRYDLGNPLGWLKANISLALQDPKLGPQVHEFLTELQTSVIPSNQFHTQKTITARKN